MTQRFTLGGKRFLLVHATPRDPLDEYLLKDPSTWAKRLQNVDADIVCVGHTHMQFKLEVNGIVVLNPGSVGLPRDGDPRAGFAIIDDNKIEMKRVAYPIEETDRPDRGDALAAPGQGHHWHSCFDSAACRPWLDPERSATGTRGRPGSRRSDRG